MLCPAHMLAYLLTIRPALRARTSGFALRVRARPKRAASQILGL